MPPYFRFLTVMAFNVFLKEKVCPLHTQAHTRSRTRTHTHTQVDVAVIEVGIGGTFDSTNIIP